MPRRVILLNGEAREESGILTVAAMPGMLMERVAGGWRPHTVAGGAAQFAFVREQHENDGHGVDDEIPANDEGTILFPTVGARINALTADSIELGDPLESAGDGTLQLRDLGAVVGFAGGPSEPAEDDANSLNRVVLVVGGSTPDLTSV